MEERPDLDEMRLEFEEPQLITDLMMDADVFKKLGLNVFAVNLEYLIQNAQRLHDEKNKDYYAVFSSLKYYSPKEWKYDFTQSIPRIHLETESEPALIMSSNNEPFLCYVTLDLIHTKPQVVHKAYSKQKTIEPIILDSPLFSLNIEPSTEFMVPYVLCDCNGVLPIDGTSFYQTYGKIPEDY